MSGHFMKHKQIPDDSYLVIEKVSDNGKSNIMASSSSLLSSSSASYEGCSTAGTAQRSQDCSQGLSMQTGPIQKGHNLHGNGRINGSRSGILAVKRRGVKVKEPENGVSLEERLRALTTIEEEDPRPLRTDHNLPNGQDKEKTQNQNKNFGKISLHTRSNKQQSSSTISINTSHNERTVENKNFEKEQNHVGLCQSSLTSVTSTAASSSVDSSNVGNEELEKIHAREPFGNAHQIGQGNVSGSSTLYNDGWNDYRRYFEKSLDVPAHNIDTSASGKLSKPKVNNSLVMVNSLQNIVGSPSVLRKDGVGYYQNQGQVNGESVNSQLTQVGLVEGLIRPSGKNGEGISSVHTNNKNDQSGEKWNVLHEVYDLRSVPTLYARDLSQRSGPWLQNQTFQGESLKEQLQQQFCLQQHYQQHQLKSHGQPSPEIAPSQHPNMLLFQHMNSQKDSTNSSIDSCHNNESNCYFSHNYPVLQRQSLASPGESLSYPWPQVLDQQNLAEFKRLGNTGMERSSLDLGSIPNLQRQIRANSMLCLQASRKHAFASSADIRKLFSGRKNPSASLQSPGTNCVSGQEGQPFDHSVHFTTSGVPLSNPTEIIQAPFNAKPGLWVVMPSGSFERGSSNFTQTDPRINIPPEAWTNVTPLQNSKTAELDKVNTQMGHPPTQSPYYEFSRPTFPKSSSACTDLGTDRSQSNGLSSGYSSESEMQQIESNAEEIRKHFKIHDLGNSPNSSFHKFIPLHRSVDQVSNSDTEEDMPDGQLLHENSLLMVGSQTSDSLEQPSESLNFPYDHVPSSDARLPYSVVADCGPSPIRSSGTLSANSYSSSSDVMSQGSNSISINNARYLSVLNSENQVTDFTSNHTVISDQATTYPSVVIYKFNTNNNVDTTPDHSNYGKLETTRIFPSFLQQNLHPYNHLAGTRQDYTNRPDSLTYSGPSLQQEGPVYLHGYQNINSGGNFPKMSPVVLANFLEVPFETKIISDEDGDRLTTLV